MNDFSRWALDFDKHLDGLEAQPLQHLNIFVGDLPMWRIRILDTAGGPAFKFAELHGWVGPMEGSGSYYSRDKEGRLLMLIDVSQQFGASKERSRKLRIDLTRDRRVTELQRDEYRNQRDQHAKKHPYLYALIPTFRLQDEDALTRENLPRTLQAVMTRG